MNIWLPEINHATPRMDIYKLQKQLYKCTEANAKVEKRKSVCISCPYYKTSDCWQRLMLDSAHALALLLAERDEGKPLIVEVDEYGEEK